jgi:3-oxoacyl-[acyl-carrier protein] reductase
VSAERFDDRVVLVTGGSRGIGRAIAIEFAKAGADVVLNYNSRHEAAAEVMARVEEAGRRCVLVAGSVADPRVAQEMARAALERFGRIDVLVNNAGVNRDGNLMLLPDAAWTEVLDVNVNGAFYCTRAVLGPMRAAGAGVIINMTSTAGLKGRAGQANYAATKGALVAFTKSLAQELGAHGIRVNAIAPGFVETDMVGGVLAKPEARQSFLDATPAGRFGRPEDVAGAALYLASARSAYVTGHVLLVNGGLFV